MNCHPSGLSTEHQNGQPAKRLCALILIVTALLATLSPCEVRAATDKKSEKLLKDLRIRFNRYPQLRQYGFRVKILTYANGILTLTTSKKPETKSSIRKANIDSIWRKLMGITERLAKSYPEVKTVIWVDQKDLVAPVVVPMTPTKKAKKKGGKKKKESKDAEKKTEKPMTNFSAKLGIRNMAHEYWKSPAVDKQTFYGISVDHEEKGWKAGVLLELTYSTATVTDNGIDIKNAVTAVDVGGIKSWYLKDILIPSLSAGASIIQIKDEGFKGGKSQGKTIEFYYGYFVGASFLFYFDGLVVGVTGKYVGGTTDGFGDYMHYGAVLAWGF